MTELDRVDVRDIENLSFQALSQLDPEIVDEILLDSDLILDPETLQPTRFHFIGPGEPSSFVAEDALVHDILQAAGSDRFLDVTEVHQGLAQKILPKNAASRLSAPTLLTYFENLMQDRYRPIIANIQSAQQELTLTSYLQTLDLLKFYRDGLLKGEASLDPAFSNLQTEEEEKAFFAALEAHPKFVALQQSINNLQNIIFEGLSDQQDWAVGGDIRRAMLQLGFSDYYNLDKVLCASLIHYVLNWPDLKERFTLLYEFVNGDRSKAGGNGLGIGLNWKSDKFPNGKFPNLHFAGSMLRFLAVEAKTDDPAFDAKLHRDAKSDLQDLLGDGGDKINRNLVSNGILDPSDYRDWSDHMEFFGKEMRFPIDREIDFDHPQKL